MMKGTYAQYYKLASDARDIILNMCLQLFHILRLTELSPACWHYLFTMLTTELPVQVD